MHALDKRPTNNSLLCLDSIGLSDWKIKDFDEARFLWLEVGTSVEVLM